MQKFLILLFACLLCTATQVFAQVPEKISFLPSSIHIKNPSPEKTCTNFAGTFHLGQFIGMSNSHSLDTIYLCKGDSIFIIHNGDQDLSGDPVPSTAGGIGWAFYKCKPTISGPDLATIISDVNCIEPGGPNGIWVYTDQQNGSAWFYNNGLLQAQFNANQPVLIWYAPITLDSLNTNVSPSYQGFESAQVGFPPGPCVNLNTNVAFAVVYMNAISVTGINPNFNNDCVGKFRVQGGYPEFDKTAVYEVSITPSTPGGGTALIQTAQTQLTNNADVIFSVSQPGIYNIVIKDSKGCMYSFQMNMSACNPADNLTLSFPQLSSPPGTQVCVPLTVQNFDIVSGSFSISFDPTVLQYVSLPNTGVQNPNPAIGSVFPGATLLNQNQTLNGELGVVLYNTDVIGGSITIPNGQTLFEVCFNVIGPLGQCSPIGINANPTFVSFENTTGQTLGVTVDTGLICSNFAPVNLTVAVKDTLCQGRFTITAHGGKPGYDVTIGKLPAGGTKLATITNDGGTFVYFTGFSGNGQYLVCISDSNGIGMPVCDTVTLQVDSVGAALDLTHLPSCNGSKDGSASATVFLGGSQVSNPGPNFSFAWNIAGAGTASTATGLGAGTVIVTVTDSNTGCIGVASGTMGQPAAINRTVAQTDATCTGVCDGSITYTVSGGTPFAGNKYNYNWTYSASHNPANVIADAFGQNNPIALQFKCGGSYYVTVTDANGCTRTDSVVLNNIRELTANLDTLANVTCNGMADGKIRVKITSNPVVANPTYTFFWTPVGGVQLNAGSLSTYSQLTSGGYHVKAVDAQGCTALFDTIISQPQPLTVTALSVQQPSCSFLNNGKILLSTTGGNNNYTYVWDDGTTGLVIQNKPAGTYCATVTDGKGCSASICTTLVLPPPPPFTSIDSVSVKCGKDGCLTANAPTAAIYTWILIDTSANGTTVGNTAQICNLAGGTYVVSISDAMGCINKDTIVLGGKIAMSLKDTSFTQPTCFGTSDGLISVGVQGGTAPFVYHWMPTSPIQTGPTLINAAAGFYTLTIMDANNCQFSTELELKGPPQIQADFLAQNITGATCHGLCNGQAAAVVTYKTTPVTYGKFVFTWDDISATKADSLRKDLCAGIHNVTIIDAHNCSITATVSITEPNAIDAKSVTIDSISCFGIKDGCIQVVAEGGNGAPYQFNWSANAGSAITAKVCNLGAAPIIGTDYVVTITDSKGCTGTQTVHLTEPDQIVVTATAKSPTCAGGNNGEILLAVSGGTPGPNGYGYAWLSGAGIPGMGNPLTLQKAGSYAVTVSDSKNCMTKDTITLVDPPQVMGSYLPLVALKCHGDETQLTIDSIWGGAGGPYQFSVDYGVTLDQGFPVSIGGGQHFITYYDVLQCSYTDSLNLPEPPPITVTFDPPTIEIQLGDTTLQLLPHIVGASVDSFIWTPSNLLLNPDSINPIVHTFETATFNLTVYDLNKCKGTGSVVVNIDPNRNVFIPNVFHANNPAGRNDHFAPFIGLGVDLVNYMQVYDRWGELLYERKSFIPEDQESVGWDGRFKGQYVNPGVYIYAIEVKFKDGRVLLYRGDVTVLR